jgi:acylphosphatase
MTDMRKRLEFSITGNVQGVGFRDIVLNYAEQRGVCGTVENLPDGSVRVVSECDEVQLNAFFAEVRGYSDTYVRIYGSEVEWSEAQDTFSHFQILYGDVSTETFERLCIGVRLLKDQSEMLKESISLQRQTNNKQDQMIEQQVLSARKQDQMIEQQVLSTRKQDQMIGSLDAMRIAQDETVSEIRGMREDLKTYMNREFSQIRSELFEIREALRQKGIMH